MQMFTVLSSDLQSSVFHCMKSACHVIPLLHAHWLVSGREPFCLHRAYGTASESWHRSLAAPSPSCCLMCSSLDWLHWKQALHYRRTILHIVSTSYVTCLVYLTTSMDGALTLICPSSLFSSSIAHVRPL